MEIVEWMVLSWFFFSGSVTADSGCLIWLVFKLRFLFSLSDNRALCLDVGARMLLEVMSIFDVEFKI